MTLTGPQRQQLLDALLSSLPGSRDLPLLVSRALNEKASVIVKDGTLPQQLNELVDWAESRGRLDALVKGAVAYNPGNLALQEVAAAFDGWIAAAPPSSRPGMLVQPPAGWASPVKRNNFRYKLVVFDLDGTLLRGEDFSFSWEAVWRALNFTDNVQNELRREYRGKTKSGVTRDARVKAYQEWCDSAVESFKNRGLTRTQVRDICGAATHLTVSCREAIAELRAKGVATAIVSGGINTFLEDAFPGFADFFDFVFINRLDFTDDGLLSSVLASEYDFEGKAEALDLIAARVGCAPGETVFVGDHFNDEAVMLRARLAIAYPPRDVVVRGASQVSIPQDDLMAILPHILVN